MYAASARRHSVHPENDQLIPPIIIPGITDYDENDKIITLNISGKRFQTYESTLARFPDSLLGNQDRRKKFYKPDEKEYFFDRHRPTFESILYFYQSKGIMAKPPNIPVHVFINELIFFDVGDDVILKLQLDNGLKEIQKDVSEPDNWLLKVVWQFLENPQSSRSAKYFAFTSVIIIVISLVLFIIETLPEFGPKTITQIVNGVSSEIKVPSKHDTPIFYVNTAVIVWFTVEFILRFISCPSKLKFFIEISSIIDFLSILPYYIQVVLAAQGDSGGESFAMLRIIRVLRVFKLARHSRGLQILGNTLKASFNELMMLAFFLFVMILIFSSCAYYAEYKEKDTKFKSIPASFWWAIVTMTTVGYGDMYPKTFWGQIIGSMAVVCGVLTIALPVPVVVSNFEYFYTKERNRKKTEDARKEQDRAEKEAANVNSGQLSRRFHNLKLKLQQISSRNSPVETPCKERTSPRDIKLTNFATANGSLLRRASFDDFDDDFADSKQETCGRHWLDPLDALDANKVNTAFISAV